MSSKILGAVLNYMKHKATDKKAYYKNVNKNPNLEQLLFHRKTIENYN
jgi:hypothetical protein